MSDSDNRLAINVEGVSKRFCRELKRSLFYGVQDTLTDLSGGSLELTPLRPHEFWANRDVSFQVRLGECVGLIGHNGAGKTTILKMLNGLIKPDRGSVTLRGRVGALIALGAGFNPLLTGRENVYINGAVLGLRRAEITARLDQIIDFAEISEFIDSPVRNYSSGMQVRLGFAVATAMQPDILLIDEVLAVGDLDFRMKCISRVRQALEGGTAAVLVSHSMIDIQRVCTRTIVMDHGSVAFDGDVSRGIANYEALATKRQLLSVESPTRPLSISLVDVTVNDSTAEDCSSVFAETGDQLEFVLRIDCHQPVQDVRIRLFIDSMKLASTHVSSLTTAETLPSLSFTAGQHSLKLRIERFPLRIGAFYYGISAHTNERDVIFPNTQFGTLHITGPPLQLAAKGDTGFVVIAGEWSV